MNRAIDPPEVSAMDKAWDILEELGAIDADGRLTALGRHIVRIYSLVSFVHDLTNRSSYSQCYPWIYDLGRLVVHQIWDGVTH